jgi:hypothetical protein
MRIEILEHALKSYVVRIVNDDGRTLRTFTYLTVENASRAARAWTVAHGSCPVDDKTGLK